MLFRSQRVAQSDAESQAGMTAMAAQLANTQLNIGADLAIFGAEAKDRSWLVQPGLGLAYRQSAFSANSLPGPQGSNIGVKPVESSTQLLPYYGFAAEARPFSVDWMVLRLGARQTIIKTNNNGSNFHTDANNTPQGATESYTSTVKIGRAHV